MQRRATPRQRSSLLPLPQKSPVQQMALELHYWEGMGVAEIARVPGGRLAAGEPAEVNLLDLETPWQFTAEQLRSKSENCPFLDREADLYGRTVWFAMATSLLTAGELQPRLRRPRGLALSPADGRFQPSSGRV